MWRLLYHQKQAQSRKTRKEERMITVYTTPTCVFCKAVKQYLKDKKVEFKEKDLTQDQESAKWVYESTGQMAVPVTVINDTIIVGFDRPQIDAALAS